MLVQEHRTATEDRETNSNAHQEFDTSHVTSQTRAHEKAPTPRIPAVSTGRERREEQERNSGAKRVSGIGSLQLRKVLTWVRSNHAAQLDDMLDTIVGGLRNR